MKRILDFLQYSSSIRFEAASMSTSEGVYKLRQTVDSGLSNSAAACSTEVLLFMQANLGYLDPTVFYNYRCRYKHQLWVRQQLYFISGWLRHARSLCEEREMRMWCGSCTLIINCCVVYRILELKVLVCVRLWGDGMIFAYVSANAQLAIP